MHVATYRLLSYNNASNTVVQYNGWVQHATQRNAPSRANFPTSCSRRRGEREKEVRNAERCFYRKSLHEITPKTCREKYRLGTVMRVFSFVRKYSATKSRSPAHVAWLSHIALAIATHTGVFSYRMGDRNIASLSTCFFACAHPSNWVEVNFNLATSVNLSTAMLPRIAA